MKTPQDLLNLWIERGAKYSLENITSFEPSRDWYSLFHKSGTKWQCLERHWLSIYTILFAPESNFFEVMFPTEEYGGIKAWEYEWEEMREEECVYISRASFHKMQCVVSPDPIQYCIDNIQRPE